MRQEERNQLIEDLETINECREEATGCALDMSKNVADHFVKEDIVALVLVNKSSRGDWSSDASCVDQPGNNNTDEESWGMKCDCASIASISSNISMEDNTRETSLIDLTNSDKNDDREIADDDTSASRKVAGNLTIGKNILNFLKEIRGLIKCTITYVDMIELLMGTDLASYERDEISQWLRESAIYQTSREPMQMHYLIPDYTMRRILSALEDHMITEEFIDHINKASSNTAGKIP